MIFDEWKDLEKRSIRHISSTCSDILNDVKDAIEKTAETWQKPVTTVQKSTAKPAAAVPNALAKQKKTKNLPKGGRFLQGLGIGLACLNGFLMLCGAISMAEATAASAGDVVAVIAFALLTAGSVVLSLFGRKREKARKRYEAYLKLIGDQDAVSIHAISDVLGMDYRNVVKDFKDMIMRGILSPAWLDLKTYRLMLTEYTGEIPVEKKEECLSRSERILRQIRADNDLIADEEVSRKIDRIEDLTRKIFAVLDKYPEKEKQLYSFLNYYLPTTLKTLESYARLEAQGIETETIRQTKQKINGLLDELCEGYERQLDKLFENDAVDITADIEVMRKMMARDGLKDNDFMKAKEVTK